MSESIFVEGRNCWQVAQAARAALLTNADYFRQLAQMLKQATRRIVIIGWDLDAGLKLFPHGGGPEAMPLSEFLGFLLSERPELDIRILLWDRTIFYGGNKLSAPALQALQQAHANFRCHYAAAALASSHHTKLVMVDDSIAFIGGIDLAGDRWDRTDHPPTHPDRVTPEGIVYGPIHDLQIMLAGPVARALAAYAAERWLAVSGEILKPLDTALAWPSDLAADLTDINIGIARTDPRGTQAPIREIEALNRDLLARARDSIYIEAQYLTADSIGDMLAQRLAEPDGPEIIIIVTRTSHGYVEQFAMGNNRDRLLRRLHQADKYRRLCVYYPTGCDGNVRAEVKIHAKLMLIDDCLLRIGSSNLNNRSQAIDTECDVVIEAADEGQRAAIRAVRDRLVADQLHQPVERVRAALEKDPSICAAINALNDGDFLQPLDIDWDGPAVPMPGTSLLDPQAPVGAALWAELGLEGTAEALAQFAADEQHAANR